MKLEIESAANFLSNFLRLQPNCLTGDQLEIFRETIFKLLTTHYQQHWFPEKPVRGSGYRCLRINHKMDPIIAKAGSCCGLNEKLLRGYLPKELTLWVDPKEVSYRIGENGSICVLFNGDNEQDNQDKVQETQSPTATKASSPVPSVSSLSSNCSSLSSSPTSSLDWSHSISFESRRSPVSLKSNQLHSPRSSTTGSDVAAFQRSSYKDEPITVQTDRYGRVVIERHWNWNSFVNASYPHHQQFPHHTRQQNVHGRNISPPLSHQMPWHNFLEHKINHRNSRFNANMEQLATYVSS